MNCIPVIYQDNDLVVVEKPVNIPVHKNDFMPKDAPYLTKIVGQLTGKSVYNVHRLDSKTSGLIVLAFSKEIAHALTLQFEKKEVCKTYYAIVRGNPGEGTFDHKVIVKKKTNFRKEAKTHYKTLKSFKTDISYKDQAETSQFSGNNSGNGEVAPNKATFCKKPFRFNRRYTTWRFYT